jgi:predicted RNA-binding Zn ribbon-like protein
MANVVVDFLNTRDVAAGTESLTAGWLVAHGLASSETVDLQAVREFRERLRGALAGEAESLSGTVTVHIEAGAGARLEGSGPVERVLALLAAEGVWERLKVCGADDCRWAFYDTSRNRSRTWCSMADCGNRAKVRAYRARRSAPG